MKAIVIDYITPLHLTLPPTQRSAVLSALNRHHVGKDVIAMDEAAPEPLKEAHRNVNMGQVVRVKVLVYEDGTAKFEIVDEL